MRERKVKIAGWGNTLSGKKIEFDGQTRYRLDKDETLLMLAVSPKGIGARGHGYQ